MTLTHSTERVSASNCYDYNFGNHSGQKKYHGGSSHFLGGGGYDSTTVLNSRDNLGDF